MESMPDATTKRLTIGIAALVDPRIVLSFASGNGRVGSVQGVGAPAVTALGR